MPTRALVIVESPAKTKKIASFLGPGFTVLATMGHIRALEEDLDAVGIDRDFEPRFRFLSEKSKATKPILEAAKAADTIYLAADDDREGEAIAYSVACLLKKDPLTLPRAVFHEITSKAVKEAIANPRRLDMHRVMAQQARAVLDMMVGFTISPCLWKHVARSLSAGRCQTPALRLVWDREQTIQNHSAETTWALHGQFNGAHTSFSAKMVDALDDQESAMNYMENIHASNRAVVTSAENKTWRLNPPKPLITSTLQQEASALYHMNPKSTMKIAQTLYEAGHITYMRTDHAILSEEAILAAQEWVREHHGADYVGTAAVARAAPETPKKGKKAQDTPASQAQEAHEAIRPTHMEITELPGDASPQEKKLYQLIWRRAVQACMSAANGQSRGIVITLDADDDSFPWIYTCSKTEFLGWQILGKVANLDAEDDEPIVTEEEKRWKEAQALVEGTPLTWSSIQAQPNVSKAKPRFTEATLIRDLEQKGIGRPSTFASLVEVLFDKLYVEKQDIAGKPITQITLTLQPSMWPPTTTTKQAMQGAEKQKLVPTALGESVLKFCLQEFPQLFAYDFTAEMEARLDRIAKGEEEWKDVCRATWDSYKGKYQTLMDKASKPTSSDKVADWGNGFKAVMSKSGPLLVQEGSTKDEKAKFYSFPPGYTMQTITEDAARAHIASLAASSAIGEWKGQPLEKKKGPYGFYVQWGELRVPFTEGETLPTIVAKLEARQQSASNTVAVGGYRFAVGQYGPYMWKEGLKTKQFVGIPSTTKPSELTLAQAEELYKTCSEAKKASGSGSRGGFRGRGGKGGFRGGGR